MKARLHARSAPAAAATAVLSLFAAAAFLFAASASASGARAQPGRDVAGMLVEIKGDALIRTRDGAESRLDARRDRVRVVYEGEKFRCPRKGCVLKLKLGREVKVIRGPSPWFTIESAESEAYRKAMADVVRKGGRSRGVLRPVYSPAAYGNGAAASSTFTVRWTPAGRGSKVWLKLSGARGEELWRRDALDGDAGSLSSPELRRALALYRDESEDVELVLDWRDDTGLTQQSKFELLSARREGELDAALASWGAEPDALMRHLGRASVYNSFKLLPQAAEEYEAALALAPESRDLLRRTVTAQFSTGNVLRAEELERRLAPEDRP